MAMNMRSVLLATSHTPYERQNCAGSQGATFMSPQRGTETEQLFQIIEVIQLGRKTGTLYVEREYHARVETGRIQFYHGQISDARGGQQGELNGATAIRWLRTWSACRFFFAPMASSSALSPTTGQITQPLASVKREELSPVLQDTPSQLHEAHVNVPHTLQQGEHGLTLIERARLSRLHRRVFLLIDGKRSIRELARLTGKGPGEIQQVLHDLTRLAIVDK